MMSSCKTTDQAAQKQSLLHSAPQYGFEYKKFATTPLPIYGWARIDSPEQSVHVYIEGDGFAYISKSRASSDPTPTKSVAMNLAKADTHDNVVYLARPCHFGTDNDFKTVCHKKYWTTHRYGQNVLQSFHAALNSIGSHKFDLIGHSGGANIAGLIAVSRNDIQSIRTVAGNVDNDFFTRHHNVSDMPYSLNMADYAAKLSNIPQYHFIAQTDKFVPKDIYQNYRSKLSSLNCTNTEIITGTKHLSGWASQWPQLIKKSPACG